MDKKYHVRTGRPRLREVPFNNNNAAVTKSVSKVWAAATTDVEDEFPRKIVMIHHCYDSLIAVELMPQRFLFSEDSSYVITIFPRAH